MRNQRIGRLRGLVLPVLWLSASFGAVASQETAENLFRQEEWSQAIPAFENLLKSDPTNSQNWFRLARALEQVNEPERALHSYQQALKQGHPSPVRIQYSISRMMMLTGQPKSALKLLEEIASAGGALPYRVVQSAPEFESIRDDARFVAVVEALKPCNSKEHRAFDFWVGDWDVTPAGSDSATASNIISVRQGGCVVLEEYTAGQFTGMSLNFYDEISQRWHQTWMSNTGGAVYLEGGINTNGSMEMTDENLPVSKIAGRVNKTVWTPNPNGTVRQVWSSSDDGGETWAVVFDGLYKRRQPN